MGMVGEKPMVNLTSCGTWMFAHPQDLKVSDLVNIIMSYTLQDENIHAYTEFNLATWLRLVKFM